MENIERIPTHVAIIMDGNGRWAKALGKERYEGHIEGVDSVRECIKAARRNGVKYLTLYAFSTENWGRPAEEVNALMELFCKSVIAETPQLVEQGVRVVMIGRRDRFSERVCSHLEQIERETADGKHLTLVLAFDYSSRDEITTAVKALATKVAAGEIAVEDISEQSVSQSLYTADIPDPDFIIRTSGECRLSNFLLWQASYAEMYFPTTMWPDFKQEQFDQALEVYASRERRYGKL
ncbi:MAG: di-trans,poly-cis-decaprenylcistransferase [Alistipes sp.]|nr:di-trans,poly-cis-decaprenylcistransferase [Rikenellaceae bacterium]MBP3497496.1 di-trans,poly-cis-decaprenylcistransferase [Alistipes sp.]MBQ8853580.1 di-trans,poly-cis-decaprenylcistransferase [Alistipes sp.]